MNVHTMPTMSLRYSLYLCIHFFPLKLNERRNQVYYYTLVAEHLWSYLCVNIFHKTVLWTSHLGIFGLILKKIFLTLCKIF